MTNKLGKKKPVVKKAGTIEVLAKQPAAAKNLTHYVDEDDLFRKFGIKFRKA